jgi:hypothetical protein
MSRSREVEGKKYRNMASPVMNWYLKKTQQGISLALYDDDTSI